MSAKPTQPHWIIQPHRDGTGLYRVCRWMHSREHYVQVYGHRTHDEASRLYRDEIAHPFAGELLAALEALLGAFDACAAAGRSGVSPAQAIAQREMARELIAKVRACDGAVMRGIAE